MKGVEVESTGALAEKWCKRRAGIVLTEDMNGSEKGGHREKAEPEKGDVGIGVVGDGDWVSKMVKVIVGCLSEATAAESAFDIALRNDDIEQLNKGKLSEDIVCGDERSLRERRREVSSET